ncbi:DUF1415 domain-containing protein [Thiomicrorhabdus xiamenensis]|uniref:DUF1415 domain-containing protein n=1 Tax=Thiomicrorhabdus xiamenensis TaxID=2739063 RepID=A0A7D4TGG2_9GAMM|nr:DUF1415 domain-containing protein [Thiomicrorhabdus xiamenensis]QKI89648.1 DUF1415 domain-containing protein [Thiomicrorhabdus xiamenensis]
MSQKTDEQLLKPVQTWLEQVVIGLNLCPFAKRPWTNHQVHLQVTRANSDESLLEDLALEIQALLAQPIEKRETTVMIVAQHLQAFDDYNQFLNWAEALIEQQNWQGIIQLASFHPDYQFAGTQADDAENLTNRAPFPLLHILREESLEKALARYPHDPESIFENNIRCMHELSEERKRELFPYLFS